MNNQHQNAQKNVRIVIQKHLPKTNIMAKVLMQLIQTQHKSKLKSTKMDQSKLLSLSMPIFFHTNQVSINTHLVNYLVDTVCISFDRFSWHFIIDLLLFTAVKVLGWGVEDSSPYWLVANCKWIDLLINLSSYNDEICLFLAWNEDWGDKGYFKISRGNNECGIEDGIVAGEPKLD